MHIENFRVRKEWLVIALLALAAAWIWTFALQPKSQSLTADFLDVGQGDCALIRTPSGRIMLVDGGGRAGESDSDKMGMSVIEPVLRRRGINRIDVVVLTHPHDDHLQGLVPVVRDFRIGMALDAGVAHGSQAYEKFLTTIENRRIPYRKVMRGMIVDFGDGVKAQVLNPPPQEPDTPLDEANDSSVVMRVSYGGRAIMLTGDAGTDTEADIIASGADLRSDVLKVGHHGSAYSTGDLWLQAVRPRYAVISVGRNNSFGHPAPVTLERLRSAGVQIYRTDKNGQVTVEITPQSCTITGSRQ